jgi:2-phosphoglycerate kinase
MIVATMSTGLEHDSTDGAKVMLPVVATGGSVGSEDVTLGVGAGRAVVNGLDWAVESFRLIPMMIRPKTKATTTTTPMIAATTTLLTPGPEGAYP